MSVFVLLLAGGILCGGFLFIRSIARLVRGEGGGSDLLIGLCILFLVACLILPAVISPHTPSHRSRCMSNLSQIGKGCAMYAIDHNEAFPTSFRSLTNYINNPKIYICPSSRTKSGTMDTVDQWSDYILVTNLNAAMASDLVLAYCKPGNHTNAGINVLAIDGSVMWQEWTNLPSLTCDVLHLSKVSVTNHMRSTEMPTNRTNQTTES